jgi:4-amino-4-deoxy-L-arabinose transferase-like glycosyltransferase
MMGFFITAIIFSFLIGITVSIIFYLIKKHIFNRPATFKKHIWIAVIVALVCFLLSLIFLNGMDKIIV